MLGRASIARLMLVVGLSGLTMLIVRAWLGPGNVFGFFGPTAVLATSALVGTLVIAGRARRFLLGFAAVGVASGVANVVAPNTTLGASNDRLVVPALRWLQAPSPGLTRIELAVLWAELGEPHLGGGTSDPLIALDSRLHRFGYRPHDQSLMVIPQTVLAGVAGLIAASFRAKPTPIPRDTGRP